MSAIIGFTGQGNVRHVSIFWQEHVEQTVVFADVDGKVHLQRISRIEWSLRLALSVYIPKFPDDESP